MDESTRGQSELVGSVLFVGIVILVISAFGVGLFTSIDSEDRQLTDISVTVTADSVTVLHAGGEPIAAADLDTVVRFEGRSERYNAADVGVSTPFKTGDRWVIDAALPYDESDRGASVSVTVISTNTGERLFEDTFVI